MPKTHLNIVNKSLRRWYARELWQARQARPLGKEAFNNILWGLESGIWAVQKGLAVDKIIGFVTDKRDIPGVLVYHLDENGE